MPLLPEYVEEINDDEVIFRNFQGQRFTYKQPKRYDGSETPDIVPIEIAAKKQRTAAKKASRPRRRKASGEWTREGLLLLVVDGRPKGQSFTVRVWREPLASDAVREFWISNWQYLTTTMLISIGGAWTVYTYSERRKDFLSWQQTEFLFEQARYLETEGDIRETITAMEGRADFTIAEIVGGESVTEPARFRRLQALDKTLNVFDRFAYAVFTAKTLAAKDLEVFAWYLQLIIEDAELREYCVQNGFRDVLRLAGLVTSERFAGKSIRQRSGSQMKAERAHTLPDSQRIRACEKNKRLH